MSSYFKDPDSEICSLPQCGFGADIDFDILIESNQFLFRVYTPKERSPFEDDTDPFFLAPRFDDQVARSPVDLPKVKFSEPLIGSYADVAQHMEWTTRTSSSYISTSFSFSWTVWEAVRRYHQGIKKDVQIAVIDATALGGRAATAVQLLGKSSLAERNEQFWKWHRFSNDSQSVLVYGMVPRAAVLASIPLLHILRKMPSYFLRKDVQVIHGNPLDQVAWDYRLRKLSYRQFCQDMSKLFHARPAEVQLRDSTAGAVRLALSFLRPFFHRVIQDDFDIAISYLRNLAITISVWPGGSWARDHLEVRKIVETMVLAVGEELKEKYSAQTREEIIRLRLVIVGLEQTIKGNNAEATTCTVDSVEVDSDSESEAEIEEFDEPTLVGDEVGPAVRRRPSLRMSISVLPPIPASFQTPITPPDSPRISLFIPRTAHPLGKIPSTPFPSKSDEDEIQVGQVPDIISPKISPSVEELTSPPPTPPPCSPIFTPPTLHTMEDSLPVQREPEPEASSDHLLNDSEPYDNDNTLGAVPKQEVLVTEEKVSHIFPIIRDLDDGEETEHEPVMERDFSVPPSPTGSWVSIRPPLSFPYSRSSRSSITSVETLCEPIELPFNKPFSVLNTDEFEFIPPFSAFRSFGLSSRTISFSEPPSTTPSSPSIDPVTVPLPPSPEISHGLLSDSPPRSRCSSSASSLSTLSSFLVTPLLETLSSRSSSPVTLTPTLGSSTRSSSPTPPVLPLESASSQSSPRTMSLTLGHPLPVAPQAFIIPPKGRISILSPLPDHLELDSEDDKTDTSSIRSLSVDTASYLVTGFLVGAFITIFLFSTQRRALLVLT